MDRTDTGLSRWETIVGRTMKRSMGGSWIYFVKVVVTGFGDVCVCVKEEDGQG